MPYPVPPGHIPAPVVQPGPTIAVPIDDPDLTLPDYPGSPISETESSGPDFELVPNYETGHGYTSTIPGAFYAPGADVGEILAEIEYTPVTTAKLGDPIPLAYGPCRVGLNLARIKKAGGELMILGTIAEGEIESIDRLLSANEDITASTVDGLYLGTSDQTGDPSILAQYGQADDLPDIAYLVASLPSGTSLKLQADIKGKKVYDPRLGGDPVYTGNAALCLADFIDTHTDYTIDWDLLEYAADYCDEIIDEENEIPRWHIGLVLKEPKDPEDYIQVLVEYANCFVFIDAGVAKIIPDEIREPDHIITPSDIEEKTIHVRKSGQRDVPTQVYCWYTVTDDDGDWTTLPAITDDPEADQPLRITELRMPGYQHKIQAQRKAIETINRATISDIEVEWTGFDRAAEITKGDVVSLTSKIGLTNKELRVLDPRRIGKGAYRILAREYSDLIYSTVQVEDDDPGDTDIPPIEEVPTPENLALSEELYQTSDGHWRSRLRATVDEIDYPFPHQFSWKVIEGGVTIHTEITDDPEMVWGPLPIEGGVTWLVRCHAIGPVNAGEYVQGSIDILGKQLPPLPPTAFTVLEASGVCYFSWAGGADIDLRGFEIRYGEVGDPWDDMTVVNRWAIAVAGESNQIPVGEWDFEIRSFDSIRTDANPIGQYSETGVRRTMDVTSDSASFHVGTYPLVYDAGESVNMTEINGTYWTDSGESWADVFGSDPLSSYPNPIPTYLADTESKWISEAVDLGQVLSVNIIASNTAEDVGTPRARVALTDIEGNPLTFVSGDEIGTSDTEVVATAINQVIETKVDAGDPWTRHHQSSILTAARYIRVSIECSDVSRMKVPPDYGELRVDVIASELSGQGTTDGFSPTTIDLGREVSAFVYVLANAVGSDRLAVIEDVTAGDPGQFDVVILNSATNAQVAGTFFWTARVY